METLKNHTLSGGTYLSSPYMGIPFPHPPPPPELDATTLATLRKGFRRIRSHLSYGIIELFFPESSKTGRVRVRVKVKVYKTMTTELDSVSI